MTEPLPPEAIHGPYQTCPPLSTFDLDSLMGDIESNGIHTPIVIDEHGDIIDGHHRRAIALQLGIECPSEIKAGLTPDEKRARNRSLNAHRRQMTLPQLRDVWEQHHQAIDAALTADPTVSDREIARREGVSYMTVGRRREKLAATVTGVTDVVRPHQRTDQGRHASANRGLDDEYGDDEPNAGGSELADHRGEVWAEVVIGYPAPSEEVRTRDGKPYREASERPEWFSKRIPLTSAAPTNDREWQNLINEIARAVYIRGHERPLRTMQGMQAGAR